MNKAILAFVFVTFCCAGLCWGQSIPVVRLPSGRLPAGQDDAAPFNAELARAEWGARFSNEDLINGRPLPDGLSVFRFFSPYKKNIEIHVDSWSNLGAGDGMTFVGGAVFPDQKRQDAKSDEYPVGRVRRQGLFRTTFPTAKESTAQVARVEAKAIGHCGLNVEFGWVERLESGAFFIEVVENRFNGLTQSVHDHLGFKGGPEFSSPGYYTLEGGAIKEVKVPPSLSDTGTRFGTASEATFMLGKLKYDKNNLWIATLAEFSAETGEFGPVVRVPIRGDKKSGLESVYASHDSLIVRDRVERNGQSFARIRNLGTGWEKVFPGRPSFSVELQNHSIIVLSGKSGGNPSPNGGLLQPRLTELDMKTGKVLQARDIQLNPGERISEINYCDHLHDDQWNTRVMHFWVSHRPHNDAVLQISLDDPKHVRRIPFGQFQLNGRPRRIRTFEGRVYFRLLRCDGICWIPGFADAGHEQADHEQGQADSFD